MATGQEAVLIAYPFTVNGSPVQEGCVRGSPCSSR